MINKIKAWPIGFKIVGGLVGLFLVFIIISFFKGMVLGLVGGFENATSDYYQYHGPKIVQLDADTTAIANDIMKMSQDDSSQSTIDDFNTNVAQVDRDVISLQAYKGSIPQEYAQAESDLQVALSDLLVTGDHIETDINNQDTTSFMSDTQKFGNGKYMLKQAAQEMIAAHNGQK